MPARGRSQNLSLPSITSPGQSLCRQCLIRSFASTPSRPTTKLRRQMFAWLNGPGENFRHPLPNATNYLSAYDRRGKLLRAKQGSVKLGNAPRNLDNPSDAALEAAAEGETRIAKESTEDLRPFPLNPQFVSQSILSEPLRQEIWRRVKLEGKTVRRVSVELGIEMRRVGAVVRLVEVERRMRAENAPLAIPYAKAVHSMLPLTPYNPGQPPVPHESINDLPIHRLTAPQLFHPTSESRHFTRVDAGRVFSAAPRLPDELDIGQGGTPKTEVWNDRRREIVGKKGYEREVLKPAEARIPHPQLVAFEQDKRDPVLKNETRERTMRYEERLAADETERQERATARKQKEEAELKRIETSRWEFVVKEVRATREGTGLDGRGTKSPGMRYGVPSHDRKKGHVKIPTRVDV